MKCPFCGNIHTRVIDTDKNEGNIVQRRRSCPSCQKRFNTNERPILTFPMVIKHDKSRQEFDREKILRGIRIACWKRPVSEELIETLVENIEQDIQTMGVKEVPSRIIGDKVIAGLKQLDLVAYFRFAIVYLQLDDLPTIRNEIDRLLIESGQKGN